MRQVGTESMLPPHVGETVVTVGTFDGVHLGHLDVLSRLSDRAAATGRASVLVTFESHPLELLRPEIAPLLLTTRDEKLAAIATTGIDYVALLPFTNTLANHSAREFVQLLLRERLRMSELLIGHDHAFGKGRAGDVETLQILGNEQGFRVDVVPPVETLDGTPISSSRIRQAIARGELAVAEASLGRRYAVGGHVIPGDARGRSMGFRTINVEPDSPRKLLPPDGVYAVRVETPFGGFGGMMNLGGRPTFDDARRTIEAHLFDMDADLYGRAVQISFVTRLRTTQRFANTEALIAQLGRDERGARAALTLLDEAANLKGSMQYPPSTP